jgi:hypothetical protein
MRELKTTVMDARSEIEEGERSRRDRDLHSRDRMDDYGFGQTANQRSPMSREEVAERRGGRREGGNSSSRVFTPLQMRRKVFDI